jgi:hypothetical protein
MPEGMKHVFFPAEFNFYIIRSSRFYAVSNSTSTFPRVLGVNDGVKQAECRAARSIRPTCLCRGYKKVMAERQYMS